MVRVRKSLIFSLGAFAVLAALSGCNGTDIEDPKFSDSVLVVQSVTPASVQADVSPTTDPNTMLMQPPADDVVTVSVKNLNRTQTTSGIFGDILVTSFNVQCANNTLNVSNSPASLTIPAESSADIRVLLAPGPFKMASMAFLLATATDLCEITFSGQDLSGEPFLSTPAVVGVSYVDTP